MQAENCFIAFYVSMNLKVLLIHLTDRLAVIYSAPGEIRVWISGHDENRTPAPHQYHGTFST